ncbi:MAG: PD-(D/E)XK nuclease family protein [Anaerolineae bacterium]|nr:PD-(D/E)XK nuclease family protein [Anaerolineae bacterium]
MALARGFAFSQASLQDYADCPRRFQLRHVLGVRWPTGYDASNAEWEERARQGAAFHRLVHQHVSGLPVEVLSATVHDDALGQWWQAYLAAPPQDLPTALRRSEARLSMRVGGLRLVARYDLLAIDPGGCAVIVDWKTSKTRSDRGSLERRWQTLVYRYVLAEAGTHLNGDTRIAPGQIELVYWFAAAPAQVERFAYDDGQHLAAGERLSATIAEIAACEFEEWPLTQNLRHCRYCAYRTLCERDKAAELGETVEPDLEDDLFEFDIDLEQIAEVEF